MSGPIVVKIGGAAIEKPELSSALWRALAELHAKEVARGSGVVLVHGGGALVDAMIAKLGMTTQRVNGLRVTPSEQIGVITGVLAGTVNKTVVGMLSACGARAVGLSLSDGGTAVGVKHEPDGIDLGRVGVVRGGDPTLLRKLIAGGFLPVLSSIALDAAGGALNVNADDAASAIGGLIGARRVVLLTDVEGVWDENRRLVRSLTVAQLESLIETGVITGGMIPKVRAAACAAEASGVPTLIDSWGDPATLVDLGADDARGTLVTVGTRARTTPAKV